MTFLRAIFLFGLLASAIPLIIHLFNKRKKETINFSSLYFLKILESKKIKQLKLRQILLLILRMLLLALIALVFARPAFTGRVSSAAGDSNISCVVIFDNSLSTNMLHEGTQVFSHLKRKARDLLNSLGDGDEIVFINSTQKIDLENSLVFGNKDEALNLLNQTEPSFSAGKTNNIISTAIDLLQESKYLYREIYLFSDLQKNEFISHDTREEIYNEEFPIKLYVFEPVEYSKENIGILKAELQNRIIEYGKELSVNAIVKNYGENTQRDIIVSLYIDGKRAAQKNVTLSSGSMENITFKVIPEKTGLIKGMIEVEEDNFNEDNRRMFTFEIPDLIPLLIVNESPEDNEFIEAVFANDLQTNIASEIIPFSDLTSIDLRNYDVVILNGLGKWSGSEIFRFRNYFAGGGGMIAFPGELSDLDAYNSYPVREFGLPHIGGISGKRYNPDDRTAGYLSLNEIDFEHPVFKGVYEEEKPEVELPQIYKNLIFDQIGDNRIIMRLSNNMPFFTETAFDKGRIITFSSAPSLSWNNFPIKGLFAPLLHRSVYYLAADNSNGTDDRQIDDEIEFYYNGDVADIDIVNPENEIIKVTPEIDAGSYKIKYSDTALPGIYSFRSGSEEKNTFAVNFNPEESDFNQVAVNELESNIPEVDLNLISFEDDAVKVISESRMGKEISKYFLAVVLFLIAFEVFLQYEKPETDIEENIEKL